MSSIKIKCFCGEEFAFCEDNIPEGQTYEAECPACHSFLKRRKVKDIASPKPPKLDISTTKCPLCGKLNLRIGDYGVRDIREEFRVICDSCDFCSETQSSDYGEVFWDFMAHEYERVAAEHNIKEPEMIAWSRIAVNLVKIKYDDGDEILVKQDVFHKRYYDITEMTKDEVKKIASAENYRSWNKLVRDRIPEIIKSNGESCTTETLDDVAEYLNELQKKLDEEIAEYYESESVEELVDIVDVVYALVKAHGISIQHFETVRSNKKKEKGGFTKRIFLKETYKDSSNN